MVMEMVGHPSNEPSYMSKKFMELINNQALKKYNPKIILGGQGVWQIIDKNCQSQMGIDCIVEGEGEKVAPKLFKDAVNGKELPKYVKGETVEAEKIPAIITPSRGGIVEITRGCGRGCKFCTPNMLKFRSLPKNLILKEAKFNVENGLNHISLHSEDFLRYGSKGLKPNEEKIMDLIRSVKKIKGLKSLSTDFAAASTVMQDPKLVGRVAEEFGLDKLPQIIEMGIETGSPRMIQKFMEGKVKPFKAEQWQDIVEQSIGILNDNGWVVCGTMITGLPGESEEDVRMSAQLLEKLTNYDCFIFVLPFISMGGLRKSESNPLEKYLSDPLRRELLKKGQ
jgi:radical SAM superfamily enzyme YgiQ (UPF0313 family)